MFRGKTDKKRGILMSLLLPLSISLAHAETSQNHFANIKNGLSKLIAPEPTRSAHSVDITSLSHYSLDTSQVAELPQITRPQQGQSATGHKVAPIIPKSIGVEAVHTAVQLRS